jgi:uncharacterized RDD family membrane protein YckC
MRSVEVRRVRPVVPPEGVPLEMVVAQAGDRAAAFLLDAIIQLVAMLLVLWAATWAASPFRGESPVMAIAYVLFFLIRSFYFIWFETRWQGRTPGKKRLNIRVMDAQGGPLRTDAIVVRNLMREVEVWIPVAFLLMPEQVWPDAPGWARIAFSLWALGFAFMPLFNRDRLRAGDMVAGTLVVESPKPVLLPDLGGLEVARRHSKRGTRDVLYPFTDKQLDVYGIYELQVLEDLLRRSDAGRREAFEAVARQICGKIGWKGEKIRPERFLREFYTALRARLERRMLLGKRKEDKHSS